MRGKRTVREATEAETQDNDQRLVLVHLCAGRERTWARRDTVAEGDRSSALIVAVYTHCSLTFGRDDERAIIRDGGRGGELRVGGAEHSTAQYPTT